MPIYNVEDDCLEGCNKEKTCSRVRKRYASNTYGHNNLNDDEDFRHLLLSCIPCGDFIWYPICILHFVHHLTIGEEQSLLMLTLLGTVLHVHIICW